MYPDNQQEVLQSQIVHIVGKMVIDDPNDDFLEKVLTAVVARPRIVGSSTGQTGKVHYMGI